MTDDNVTVLFIGDSVTDCGRRDDADRNLGDGYVRLIDEAFTAGGTPATVLNRGINGDRVRDLSVRWDADVVSLAPTLVSVMIGVNDTWRRYSDNDATTLEEFTDGYRSLLAALPPRDEMALVLMEPFLLPVSAQKEKWRDDLDPKIEAVHALAEEFGALLVPTDAHLNEFDVDPRELAADGIHPTPLGHRFIAALWLETIERASS
jgi:acyl-CoA thioesterase-1